MEDYQIKREIKNAKEELRADIGRLEKSRQADRVAMSDGFNKLAQAVLSLTSEIRAVATEVRALRTELSPQKLDKPRPPGLGSPSDNTG